MQGYGDSVALVIYKGIRLGVIKIPSKKKFRMGVMLGVFLVIVIAWGVNTWNSNRVKDIGEMIDFNQNEFVSMELSYSINGTNGEWSTESAETTKELIDFLSAYKVKKDEGSNLLGDYLEIQINDTTSKPLLIHITEDKVHYLVGKYYKLLNGPINLKWVEDYINRHNE